MGRLLWCPQNCPVIDSDVLEDEMVLLLLKESKKRSGFRRQRPRMYFSSLSLSSDPEKGTGEAKLPTNKFLMV